MKKISFALIAAMISLNAHADMRSDMFDTLSDKQLLQMSKISDLLSHDPKAAASLIAEVGKEDKNSTSKTSPKSDPKDIDIMDALKSLGKALSVDLVMDTFTAIKTKIDSIWEKKEEEEQKKNSSLWNKIKHYGSKALQTYWAIEWNLIKFSWTVGFKVLKDMGPKILKAYLA